MPSLTTINRFHRDLITEVFSGPLQHEEAMLLFWILHDCEIEVHPGVLNKEQSVTAAAITQRHAGEVVALLFSGSRKKPNDKRGNYIYWYHAWQEWGSYGHAKNLNDEEIAHLKELKNQLENHPWVKEIREEE